MTWRAVSSSLKRPRLWGTVALAALVMCIRFRALGYTEVIHDQARTLNMALQWVHGGPLPLVADRTSLGVHNPPLVLYLYALPLLLKEDVVGVSWLVAGLNALGVLATGWATGRVFGWRAGWWAALLFGVAPWPVYYGHYVWQASLSPAFAAGTFAFTLLYFAEAPRTRYLLLGSLCLSATLQTNVTSATLLPVLLAIGVYRFRQFRLWPLLASAGLFALSLAPYLVYQFTTRVADLAALQSGLANRPDTNLTAVELAFDLFRSRTIFDTLGRAADLWRGQSSFWLSADRLAVVWLIGALALAIGTAGRLRKGFDRQALAALLLILWFWVPIMFFIPHQRFVINHYFLHIVPAGFVLMGWLGDWLFTHLLGWASRLGIGGFWGRLTAGVAFVPLAFIAFQQTWLDVAGQNLNVAGASGQERMVDVRQAIASARQLMAARPDCQLVVVAEEPLWENSRFGLMREFVGPSRVRFLGVGSGYLYPYPCAVYFSFTSSPLMQAWLSRVALPLAGYTIQTPEQTWQFYDLPAAAREAAVAAWGGRSARATWANGLQLNQFVFRRVEPAEAGNDQLELTYTWEAAAAITSPQRFDPPEMRFGNYLLSLDNRLVSQIDGVGLDGREWHPRDVFQTTWRLPLPSDLAPGQYALATAIYSLPDIRRTPLAGEPTDLLVLDTISLPLK